MYFNIADAINTQAIKIRKIVDKTLLLFLISLLFIIVFHIVSIFRDKF